MTQELAHAYDVAQKEGLLTYPYYLSILFHYPGIPEPECFAGARMSWGSSGVPILQILQVETQK